MVYCGLNNNTFKLIFKRAHSYEVMELIDYFFLLDITFLNVLSVPYTSTKLLSMKTTYIIGSRGITQLGGKASFFFVYFAKNHYSKTLLHSFLGYK